MLGLLFSGLAVLPAAAAGWDGPSPGERDVSPAITGGVLAVVDGLADALTGGSLAQAVDGGARPVPEGGQMDGPGFVPPVESAPEVPAPTPVRELVELRSAHSSVVENTDGSRTVTSFPEAKFFEATPGVWEPIDNAVIVDEQRPGWLRNTAGAWSVSFGPLGADGSGGVELVRGETSMRVWPEFAQVPAGGIVPVVGDGESADTVTYFEVLPGVDLEYVVTGSGVKENIVLHQRVDVAEFGFVVEGVELAAVEGAPSGLLSPGGARDAGFVVTSPFVTDVTGRLRSDAAGRADVVGQRAESAEGRGAAGGRAAVASRVVVDVDAEWLGSLGPEAFPVVVDPTFTDTGQVRKNFDHTGYSPGAWAYAEVFVGNNYASSTNQYWHSFQRFEDYDAAFGNTVTNATIHVREDWGNSNTSLVQVHEATTDDYLSWSYSTFDSTVEGSTSFQWTGSIDVTAMVQGWVAASADNQAVMFKGSEVASVYSSKRFEAELEVTYSAGNSAPPAAVVAPAPPNNGVVVTEAPTLSVAAVTDPDVGDTVEYRFVIDDNSDFSSPTVTGSWGSSPTYTVSSGALATNKDYWWRVESRDNHANTTVPTSGFKLRRTTLGYEGLGGTFRGINTLSGNFVFTETDAAVASTGPALGLSRTFNTADDFVGPFGRGWSSPYFMRWYLSGSNVVVQYPDGRRETHTPDGSGGWVPPADYTAVLQGPITGGGYSLTQLNGMAYEFTNATQGGWLTSITDAFGRELEIDYTNIAGGAVVLRDVTSGREITLAVSGPITGLLIDSASIPNPAGGTYTWTYDYDNTYGDQRLVEACDARGASFCKDYTWAASSTGRLTHVYDRKGQLDIELTYGTTGRITAIEDAAGNVTTFSYYQSATAPHGIETQMTDARTNVWEHDYDVAGNLVAEYSPGVTDPWAYTYDAVTRMRTSVTDPNANTSTYVYDDKLRPVAVTNGEGETSFTVFDDVGNAVKSCDGRSVDANADHVPDADTYCVISDFGGTEAERAIRLIRSRTAPGTAPELWTYTTGEENAFDSTTETVPAGLARTFTDQRGKVTFYEYAATGDLVRVSDSGGPAPATPTRYQAESASSNIANCTAAGGYTGTGYRCNTSPTNGQYVNFTGVNAPYEDLYEVTIRYSAPAGTANRSLFVNATTEGTALQFPKTASASDWQTLTVTVPLSQGSNSIELDYVTAAGSSGDLNIDAVDVAAHSAGGDTRYSHDALGRMLTATQHSDAFPGGVATAYTYDAVNNPLTVTEAAVTNPVSGVTHQLRTTNTFDANSNLTATAASDVVGGDATRTTSHDYDVVDRNWRSTNAENGVTERRFDAVGNVVHASDPAGRWVRTTFNARNLPTKAEALGVVANPDVASVVAVLSETVYDDGGRVTATIDTRGERVETSYDNADRAVQVVHIDYQDDLPAGADRDVLLARYSYDDAGRVIQVEEGGTPAGTPMRITTSTYDNAGRLTGSEVEGVDRATALAYNTAGDVASRTTTQPGVAAGGVSSAQTRFTYDSSGRVRCETVENGATDLDTVYRYDSRGVRVAVIPPRGNTNCLNSDPSYATTATADRLGRVTTTSSPSVDTGTGGSSGGSGSGPLTRTAVGSAVDDDAPVTVTGATSTSGELFVVLATYAGGGTPDLAVSDTAGLSWTERATDTRGSTRKTMTSIFTAPATGATTDVTVTPGGSASGYVLKAEVFRYANHGGVGQVAAGDADAYTGGAYPATINLTIGATAASSETLSVVGFNENASTPLTPGSGWTELSDTAVSHPSGTGYNFTTGITGRHQSQVKAGTLTSASWTFGAGDEYAESYAAVEILTATPGGGGTLTRAAVGSAVDDDSNVTITGATSTAGELFVVLATYAGGGTPDLAISDTAGLSWTERATDTRGSTRKTMTSIFTATATGTTTGITVTAGGSASGYILKAEVFRYANHGGVGQVAAGDADAYTGGAYPATINLTIGATAASSETLAVVGFNENASTPLTPGSGWTELSDAALSHPSGTGYNFTTGITGRHQSQVKAGTLTSASWTFSAGDEYGESYAAVEILAGTSGSGGGGVLTRTAVGAAVDDNAAVTVIAATSTPGELFVVLATYGGYGNPDLAISDTAGLTWSERATDGRTTFHKTQASVFTATATGATTDITVSAGAAATGYLVAMEVFRYANHGGVGQVAAGDSDAWDGGSYPATINLPIGATQSTSETLAAVGLFENSTLALSPGSGWTELAETATVHPNGNGHGFTAGVTLRRQSQVKTGVLSGASWTFPSGDDINESFAAVEILAGTSGSGGGSVVATPTVTVGFNTFGETSHVRDPNGNVTTTVFDDLGRQTLITHPAYTPPGGTELIPTETYTYDAVGNLTSTTSRRGETTSFDYDIFNNLVEQTDPAVGVGTPGVWTFEYADHVNLSRQVDPTGAEVTYTYDSRNRLRAQTEVVRSKTVTPLTGAAGPQSPQNVAGASYTTWFNHDDLGRQTSITSPEGSTIDTGYNAVDDVTAVADADDKTTTSSVDVYGNPVRITDPLGRQARVEYDSAGRAIAAGAYANNAAVTPESRTETGYDADGNTISATSGEGWTSTFSHDKAGRLTAVTQPIDAFGAATSRFFYDAAGNLTRSRDPRAEDAAPIVSDAFDGADAAAWPAKWTTGQTPGGNTDLHANRGRLRTTNTAGAYSRALADATSTHGDAEVTAKVRTGGSITGTGFATKLWLRGTSSWATAGYDLTGGYNLTLDYAANTVSLRKTVSSTDSQLASTGFTFATDTTYLVRFETIGTALHAKVWADGTEEPAGWTLTATDGSHATGRAAVSQRGTSTGARDSFIDDYTVRPVSDVVTDAFDTVTTYNTWNLPESLIEPATTAHPDLEDRTFTRVYDAGGLPVQDQEPGGVVIDATFNELGQLAAETTTGASRSFGYDLAGRPTSFSHPAGTQTLIYDDRGLMIGAAGPAGNTIATYDGDAQLESRYDPAGFHGFTYTTQGELHTAVEPLTGGTVTYSYNDASQPTQIDYGTGTDHPIRTYTYDASGRLATDEMATGATTRMSAAYTYDDDGNVLTETVEDLYAATETSAYTYDRASRLSSFTRQQGAGTPETTSYRFDHSGNRIAEGATKTWTYDQRNRILTSPEGTYTWDPRGTLDKITAPSATVTEYAYDGLGRQTQLMTAMIAVDYTYDALDRIATRTRATTVDAFAYAGGALDVAEVTTGTDTVDYSRTPGGTALAVDDSNAAASVYTGANRHGDNRWNFTTNGTTTDTAIFDPYGVPLATTGTTGDNLGYQSDWTDPTTDQVWMGARWYSPADGTFQTRDTYAGEITTPISTNRYTYAHANPVSNFDPDGHAISPNCDDPGDLRLPNGTCINPGQYCFDRGMSWTGSACAPCTGGSSPLPSGICVNLNDMCRAQGQTGWAPENNACYTSPNLDQICKDRGFDGWHGPSGQCWAAPPSTPTPEVPTSPPPSGDPPSNPGTPPGAPSPAPRAPRLAPGSPAYEAYQRVLFCSQDRPISESAAYCIQSLPNHLFMSLKSAIEHGVVEGFGMDWSDDGCSDPNNFWTGRENFDGFCQQHDFGYRNWKQFGWGYDYSKRVIDNRLHSQMVSYCYDKYDGFWDAVLGLTEDCVVLAAKVWKGVRLPGVRMK